jgi:hypothetical protein
MNEKIILRRGVNLGLEEIIKVCGTKSPKRALMKVKRGLGSTSPLWVSFLVDKEKTVKCKYPGAENFIIFFLNEDIEYIEFLEPCRK